MHFETLDFLSLQPIVLMLVKAMNSKGSLKAFQ